MFQFFLAAKLSHSRDFQKNDTFSGNSLPALEVGRCRAIPCIWFSLMRRALRTTALTPTYIHQHTKATGTLLFFSQQAVLQPHSLTRLRDSSASSSAGTSPLHSKWHKACTGNTWTICLKRAIRQTRSHSKPWSSHCEPLKRLRNATKSHVRFSSRGCQGSNTSASWVTGVRWFHVRGGTARASFLVARVARVPWSVLPFSRVSTAPKTGTTPITAHKKKIFHPAPG